MLLATFIVAAASVTAKPVGVTTFTGSDEELGALIAWSVDDRTASEWWYHGGAEAAQDIFVTELAATGKFTVGDPVAIATMLKARHDNRIWDVDKEASLTIARQLKVGHVVVATVTQCGVANKVGTATVSGRLIDTSTGEIVWADEAKVSVGGFGGGVDDRMGRQVIAPALKQLVQKLAASLP